LAYIRFMNITLPADQERWLEMRIAKGEYQSAEDAVRQLIAERMIVDDSDLAWARPLVDEARAAAARGETSTLEEAVADIDQVLRSLKP
jgi:antitoxin ParD1/3/4